MVTEASLGPGCHDAAWHWLFQVLCFTFSSFLVLISGLCHVHFFKWVSASDPTAISSTLQEVFKNPLCNML